jgi:hypothetical protein
MIYLFYTSLTLGTAIALGTIYNQGKTIERLKLMFKEQSRVGNAYQLELLDTKAKLRECEYTKQTWAKRAHELAEDLNYLTRSHLTEIEVMQSRIYNAELYMNRVREQKRRHMAKKREEKANASK